MATVPQRIGKVGPSARSTLGLILGVGFGLRVVAAGAVQWYAQRIGKPCLFGDTFIYWELARTIREGTPFEVDQTGIPHFALRTPGYPLFLAACQSLFGPRYWPVRLVQAALGTVGVFFLYQLVSRATPATSSKVWTTAMIAAALAAVEPYGVGLGALILSEGLFVPLMLASLWGLAALWSRDGQPPTLSLPPKGGGNENPSPSPLGGEGRGGGHNQRRGALIALATGAANGAAILVRPSWALIVPVLFLAWVMGAKHGRRLALRHASIVALATVMVLMPWWVRNARVFGRFVPTALWVGASLYDGLSPTATGASDMRFLEEPGVVGLDEETQDAVLKRRAIDFATTHPARTVTLALIKAARFWSPWPNAETIRSPTTAWLSTIVTIPLFGLIAVGLWDRRHDSRALVLLAGPLVYFMVLHLVFVSSIRYRIPGILPALGLAAIGWERLRTLLTSRSISA